MYGSALNVAEISEIMQLYAKEISEVTPVEVTTKLGEIPTLPSSVNVIYEDNSSEKISVVWEAVDEAKLYSGKTYEVFGTIGGTTLKAVATVTVESQLVNDDFGVKTSVRSSMGGGIEVRGDYIVANYSQSPKNVNLVYALNDLDGKLIDAGLETKSIPAGSYINESIVIEYPDDLDMTEIKVITFVWDDQMIPIAHKYNYVYSAIVQGSRFADNKVKLIEDDASADGIINDMFYDSQLVGEQFLLGLDVDKLAETLFVNAGKSSKLAPGVTGYTGRWAGTSSQISGQNIGHWMSSAALMYNQTGNPELKKRLDYAVEQVAEAQEGNNGFIGGFARSTIENNVFNRPNIFSVAGFSLGNLWVPWYSMHKIFRGLTDAYVLTGNELALRVVSDYTDWAIEQTNKLDDTQFQRMLGCEFGGMPEIMAELYQITGEEKYLKLSLRFCEKTFMDALANGEDPLTGKHANTQIPKIMGSARLYKITGDDYYYRVASNFWETVTNERSYVTGGNSSGEHFRSVDNEELGVETTESCNTYNQMRLTLL